jgi:signal transduction histidine kinase
LTTILDKIELIMEGVEGMSTAEAAKKQKVLEWLRETEKLATDGVETAKHVQTFARTFQMGSEKDTGSEELEINAIVQKALEITKTKWKDEAGLRGIGIEIQTDLGKLSDPKGDYPEITGVLTSVIFNSIDALPHGGKISITTRMRDDKVEIQVADDGLGMSQDVTRRIFEPFFTTKEEKGRGIGLSVAHGIVSRHGGNITVESELGQGTTFTITLPCSPPSEAEMKKRAQMVSPASS